MPTKPTVGTCRICGQPLHRGQFYCSPACRVAGLRRSLAERFWAKVDRSGECWLWTGGRVHRYGAFGGTSAHRLAWIFTNGPVARGIDVCHNCPGGDNPLCVRPAHMFLGTRQRNMRDLVAKGRIARGSGHGRSTLTEDQVRDMRARYARGGVTQETLAAEYGVKRPAISRALNRVNWRHLA